MDLGFVEILRPFWLLVLPLLGVYVAIRGYQNQQRSDWQQSIAPEFLSRLSVNRATRTSENLVYLLVAGLALLAIGLSGPSLDTKEAEVLSSDSAMVIVLDQSLSMAATDVVPDRQTVAKRKILDLLDKKLADAHGLVVYSGSAHLVAPITKDANTLKNLLGQLSPFIMPGFGSQVADGIELAVAQLNENFNGKGHVLLITDGIRESDINDIAKHINSQRPLSILSVGTDGGGPIKLPTDGTFWKDEQGQIIIPKMDSQLLRQLALKTKGSYQPIAIDDLDLNVLSNFRLSQNQQQSETVDGFKQDYGFWFVLAALPFLLPLFRKNFAPLALAPVLFAALMSSPQSTLADDLEQSPQSFASLWQNKDQQGQAAFNAGAFGQASELFANKEWRAASQYQAGEFDQAVETYRQLEELTPQQLHNLGNALAKAGKLEEALASYDEAIKQMDLPDTQFNRDLVQQLLDQQQQEQQSQQQQQQQQQQQNQDSQESEQQQAQQQPSQEQSAEQTQQEPTEELESEPTDEPNGDRQQATAQVPKKTEEELERWLDQVEDQPGELLQQKFKIEYMLNGNKQETDGPIW